MFDPIYQCLCVCLDVHHLYHVTCVLAYRTASSTTWNIFWPSCFVQPFQKHTYSESKIYRGVTNDCMYKLGLWIVHHQYARMITDCPSSLSTKCLLSAHQVSLSVHQVSTDTQWTLQVSTECPQTLNGHSANTWWTLSGHLMETRWTFGRIASVGMSI